MPSGKGKLFDNGLLQQIRDRFCNVDSDPYSGPRIYLENSGGAMTLKSVVEVVARETGIPDNAGRENPTSQHVTGLLAGGKKDVMTILGAGGGSVAFGESTTSNAFRVLSTILHNVPGGNVVTTNLDHPAVYDSTNVLCRRMGKEWRVAGLCHETGRVPAESIARLIDGDTVALAFIHGSNILGTVNDARTIIAEARKKKPDLYIIVDGAQHGPHAPTDVRGLGCDAYFMSSYKMFSKVGASVAYLSERLCSLPHDQLIGKDKADWDLGTREQAGYGGWSAVAEYLGWLGGNFSQGRDPRQRIVAALEAIRMHERGLLELVLHGIGSQAGLLDMSGVELLAGMDNLDLKEPVVAMNVRGMGTEQAVAYFEGQGIRITNRISNAYSKHTLDAVGVPECLRISFAHYNSPQEAQAFLAAVQGAVK